MAANIDLVRTFNRQETSFVPAHKLFRSISINPEIIYKNNIEDVTETQTFEGHEGGVGKIIVVTIGEGLARKCKVLRVDNIDQDNMEYECTLVAASDFGELTEKISYKTKVIDDVEGGDGSVARITVKLYLKSPSVLSDRELLEQIQIQGFDTFEAVEDYTGEK